MLAGPVAGSCLGWRVPSCDAARRELKKVVLELGGSDFFLVLADADVERAVEVGVRSRFQNTGQSCIAAKRFLIAEQVADEFYDRFIAGTAQLHAGDSLDERTQLGPIARSDLRDRLHGALRYIEWVEGKGSRPARR